MGNKKKLSRHSRLTKLKIYVSDTTITAKIKALFAADASINSLGIHVRTNDGVVLLVGTVPSQDVLEKISKMASSINGVKKIITNIEIAE